MQEKTHVHEIFLLEHYVSLDYFDQLRETWAMMVRHVEDCFAAYMRNLNADYRSRPLPEQPDVGWGNRVLPNFRSTLQGLHQGFILLSHGDYNGLTFAHGPRSDFKGQMDYWSGWMSKADENLYGEYLSRCVEMAHNIVLTEGAYWDGLSLSNYRNGLVPVDIPAQWPGYRINRSVTVASGEKTERSGIYIPDVPQSCAQFLSANHSKAPLARVLVGYEDLLHPKTGEKYDEQAVFDERSCIWYLVERADDADIITPYDEHPSNRVVAGEKCPRTGYYFTPAQPDSRRVFQEGVVMPDVQSSYGMAIWQWAGSQT